METFSIADLPCPACGETRGSINSWELPDGDAAFECRECEKEFSVGVVRDAMAKWSVFLKWIDAAPADVALNQV